jgi:UDP-3-O-[3-hydroxymyristoyl] N-acetylglucosamine deacetylase
MVDGLTLRRQEFADDYVFESSPGLKPAKLSHAASAFLPGLQMTLRQPVHCSGIGLHSGQLVNLTLKPAAPDAGIRFVRTDLSPAEAEISGRWDNVTDTTLCTAISNASGARVATIEHLMAALVATGVDNAVIELDAAEPPAMDGSSDPFILLIEQAGTVTQSQRRSFLRMLKPVTVTEGEKSAALLPGDGCCVDVSIDFKSPAIGRQRIAARLSGMRFKRDFARARTFGFAHEVAYLKSKGLAQGGSLDNAVVIQDDNVINPGGLRFSDEFVRHKALDAVGDLFLAGGPFLGAYVGNQAGHKLNNMLLRAVMSDPASYEWARA